jgi:carbonic anhydrase
MSESDLMLVQTSDAQRSYFEAFGAQLHDLSKRGQTPSALLIACSDSRIMPERLFDLHPGQFFMIRTVANIIPPYAQLEISTASTLEYAVQILAVSHIIIMGHIGCGGIEALDAGIDLTEHPALWRWMDLARSAQQDLENRMHNPGATISRHRAMVEANVCLQIRHLLTYPFVRNAVQKGQLTLHPWVYDLQESSVYSLPECRA